MKLGEQLFRCAPFAYVVSQTLHKVICDFCLKRTKTTFQFCGGCKYVHYCSTKCQRASWAAVVSDHDVRFAACECLARARVRHCSSSGATTGSPSGG